ncbi:type VI secretion system baseplate subunit TssG [Pedobacter sp. AW1-32]|uniref:type VI secretion system baseplate subunit TssG n=1 Tax=Pedobacter sp. AW1-32 TaxID=3383026 RepID=UPI003FF0CD6D
MKKQSSPNNEIFSDYKAVAKAADLIQQNLIHIDDIEILPLGADKRAFSKDIEEQIPYFSENRLKDRLSITVNREGLYDMLPEGLFHRPPKGSSGMDEEAMIKDVRERREEERVARLFFSPFDAELNHMRILTELYENRIDKKTSFTDLNRLFELGWPEFKLLNKEQSIIWMHMLPEIQQKRNDADFVEKVLNAIFNIPFKLSDNSAFTKAVKISADLQTRLGESALGINTIIGDDFSPEHEQLLLQIGPTLPENLVGFMPGQTNRKILDTILDYLIPVETEITLRMKADEAHQESFLEMESPTSFLGYTVYI